MPRVCHQLYTSKTSKSEDLFVSCNAVKRQQGIQSDTSKTNIWSRLFGSPLAFSSGDPRKLAQAREKLNFLMPCHNNPLSEISVDSVNFFLNNPLISPMYFEKREKRGGQTRLYMYFPFLIFSCNWRLLLFLRVSITGKVLFNYLYISQLQQQ